MTENLMSMFNDILKAEGIATTPVMASLLPALYLPLAAWLNQQYSGRTLYIGLNGSQGAGKTTLAKLLAGILTNGFEKKVLVLSIDDFYLGRQQRRALAASVHPLLATRGVPGTHDTELILEVLTQVRQTAQAKILLPVFDKSIDDRLPRSQWRQVSLPVDMVIFEGWCVGSSAQAESALAQPINALEKNEDQDARWRNYVNHQLATKYKKLFDMLDILLMLQSPSWQKVYDWRLLQETKLQSRVKAVAKHRIMSASELQRFIMHYERVTRHCLDEMPSRADMVLHLNEDHLIDKVSFNCLD
ncbi:MAG: hypothetical protein EP315_08310 [Gammaproteobacteria bacterium]|nr:MAG: hypothetical protein EP315_08310 [Gammaproteobacteria bacterium]